MNRKRGFTLFGVTVTILVVTAVLAVAMLVKLGITP